MDANMIQALTERAKELECVYNADAILQEHRLTLHEMMQKLTVIIPSGFTYPEALKIRITLWQNVFETEGFEDAEIIYSAPISSSDETIGGITAAYCRTEVAEGEILPYEIKLMDTMAKRISQLAFARQRELKLLMNMLQQLDPDLLIKIGEKFYEYIQNTSGPQAGDLFRELALHEGSTYGESNTATISKFTVNSEELIRKIVETANQFISHDTVLQLLNGWIYEHRIMTFVRMIDRKDARVVDVLDAVSKFTNTTSQEQEEITNQITKQYTLIETWLKSELIHRFLSEDEDLINRILDQIRIRDFASMLKRIIGSERSMGNIGGKGAGIFIAAQILRHAAEQDPLLEGIKIPRTWYIAADHIVDFLHYNNLEELNSYKYNTIFHLRMTYDNVVRKIKNAKLPAQTVNMLRLLLEDMGDVPLIVRSSSLLEDKHNGTFSGKYKSLFLSNKGTRKEQLDALIDAVLEVYASMYNPDSIQYRRERGLLNFTEQMGVLIQEVVGRRIGPWFMPYYSGVAFAKNLFRWSSRIGSEDGLVRMVMGLGTHAVDRVNNDYPIMFAPAQPKLQINQTPQDVAYYSQNYIDLIHEDQGFMTVEAEPFIKEHYREMPDLYQFVSVLENDFITNKNAFSLSPAKDKMYITFQHTMFSTEFPARMKHMLDVLSDKLQCPVDIEFAYDGEHLYLLQCRPQGTGMASTPAPIPQNITWQDTLFTADRFITDAALEDIAYIVYVDPDEYSRLTTKDDLYAVGEAVGELNEMLPHRRFILMGPGRWGSRGDIKLGVRVTYSDICNTSALIEIARKKHAYVPELSFGTHFFQDLVEAGIVYIPLYPEQEGIIFKENYFKYGGNKLAELLPKYAHLADTVKVIEVSSMRHGYKLSIHMNSEQSQGIAYFTRDGKEVVKKLSAARTIKHAWKDWHLESEQEHWQWRHYMAQQIADSMDLERYGVRGVYLFGSTDTGSTGIGSDIDLLVYVEKSDSDLDGLRQWLDGWSRALARINFLQTGFHTEGMLDVHIVTDVDIQAGDSYAVKLLSTTEPVTALRVKDRQ